MINLVFDLSNIAYRSLFLTGGFGSKGYSFDNQKEIDQFCRKMAIDVSFIIRQINPQRTIFALDSRSWRKDISIDENEGYKANREKSKFINWDNVFNTVNEFTDILESNGFIISKVENAEADDLMCLWRDELLFNQNQHVIIVSSDEDVRQLVTFNNNVFSTVYNPFSSGKNSTKRLFIPRGFNEWLNTDSTGDIFNRGIDVDQEDFKRLRDKEGIVFEEIDGNKVALKKISCGDDGDNVPSIYSWLNENGKTLRITNSKYEKIVDYIGAKNHKDLLDKCDPIYDQLVNYSSKRPPFKIKDRLERQIKLVVLSQDVFPRDIINDFNKHKEAQLKKPNILPQSWNMNSILEGTKYVKSKNESSIFRETDRINSKLF
jgi:5'-3' exonuclease